jgi:hypothetical protein
LALATIVAYAIAFRGFLVNPVSVIAVFSGAGYSGHSVAPKIAGVTTLTQLGCVFVTVVLVWSWVHRAVLPMRFWLYFWLIIALTAFRTFAWTERLALIEVLAPLLVVGFAYRWRPSNGFQRVLVLALPILALGGAALVFGLTEYFRSWTDYERASGQSLVEFTLRRLLGYYYTALNNGAGLLLLSDWPNWSFSATGHWLRQFPFGIGAVFSYFVGEPTYSGFLTRYADPEFTNPSGVFSAFSDLGIAGAAWYAAIWGAALGYWHADFERGRGLGLLMYPVVFISLPESLRFLYLSNSRAFLVVAGTVVVYLVVRRPWQRDSGESLRASLRRKREVCPAPDHG